MGVFLSKWRSKWKFSPIIRLFWVVSSLVIGSEFAKADVILAPHRAVYRLNLIENANHGIWESVVGQMVYELTGSPCEGYQQQFRQMIILSNSEGGRKVIDDFSSLNETSDGKKLDFFSKNIGKTDRIETISGQALRSDDGILVQYTSPRHSELHLPQQTSFPIAYTKALITTALAGQTSLNLLQFDDTDPDAANQRTFAIIGAEKLENADAELDLVHKTFGKQRRWPVTIGFGYDGQLSSDYSIFQELFENGVAINLILDLNDFKLSGHLQTIIPLDQKKCN